MIIPGRTIPAASSSLNFRAITPSTGRFKAPLKSFSMGSTGMISFFSKEFIATANSPNDLALFESSEIFLGSSIKRIGRSALSDAAGSYTHLPLPTRYSG